MYTFMIKPINTNNLTLIMRTTNSNITINFFVMHTRTHTHTHTHTHTQQVDAGAYKGTKKGGGRAWGERA